MQTFTNNSSIKVNAMSSGDTNTLVAVLPTESVSLADGNVSIFDNTDTGPIGGGHGGDED